MNDKTEESGWLNFDDAWEAFYALPQRRSRPTDAEKEIAREVCEDCDAHLFKVRSDGEIIYSKDHTVHINPGFMSTGKEARHVFESNKYHGFPYRYEFTNFVVPPPPPQADGGKVLCPEYGIQVRPDVECGYCGATHRGVV